MCNNINCERVRCGAMGSDSVQKKNQYERLICLFAVFLAGRVMRVWRRASL
jgi:hypothetical protein